MGDDTWVQLFPHHFVTSYPFPSFNVKDLDTVACFFYLFFFPLRSYLEWTITLVMVWDIYLSLCSYYLIWNFEFKNFITYVLCPWICSMTFSWPGRQRVHYEFIPHPAWKRLGCAYCTFSWCGKPPLFIIIIIIIFFFYLILLLITFFQLRQWTSIPDHTVSYCNRTSYSFGCLIQDHAGHIFGVDSTPMVEKLEQYNEIIEVLHLMLLWRAAELRRAGGWGGLPIRISPSLW